MKYIKNDNIQTSEQLIEALETFKQWDSNRSGPRPYIDPKMIDIYRNGSPWEIEFIEGIFIAYKLTGNENEVTRKITTGLDVETAIIKAGSSEWVEYEAWKAGGNTPEPIETTAEKKERLSIEFRKQFDEKMLKADRWELLSIQKRYVITQEGVEGYKVLMCAMLETHTTIAKLENPEWPALPENAQ